MAEPWLDSLSEDWNSQPRSSSPAPSLPNFAAPSTPISKSSPGLRAKSRIPRPQNGLTSSPVAIGPDKNNKPQYLSSPQRRALKDRTSSEINIPLRRSSPGLNGDSKPSHLRRNSCPSSSSSAPADDFPDGSIQRKSPSKGTDKENDNTPEWKRLVLNRRKDFKSQADLFSQTALESMFEQPTPPAEDPSAQKKKFILNDDMDAMPSSPPPWPKDYRNLSTSSSFIVERHASRGVLETLEEQDEDSQDGKPLRGNQEDESVAHNQQIVTQPLSQLEPNETSNIEETPLHSQYDGPAERSDSLDNRIHSVGMQSINSNKASSSVSGGFSPVYITKHNTSNGQVGYRAIDVSDPDAVKQLQDELESSNPKPEAAPLVSQAGFDEKYANLCSVGEFVTMKRGGYSNQGSFRRRPLSPSPSSSILPSDSISQVQCQQNFEAPARNRATSADSSNPGPQNFGQSSGEKAQVFLQDIQQVIDEGDEDREVRVPYRHVSELARVDEEEEETNSFSRDSETATHLKRKTPNNAVSTTLEDSNHTEPSNSAENLISSAQKPVQAGRNNLAGLVREQHRRMQAIIGKRKDARYDTDHEVCEPSELAKRQILRPRNPTPGQAMREPQNLHDTQQDCPPNSPPPLETTQSAGTSPIASSRAMARAERKIPAPEVADFRARLLNGLNGSVRKNSVSTQDYVDEAMKIMEFIRSNRKPQSELFTSGTYQEPSLTPEQLDRPPSREGPSKPWRTKGGLDSDNPDPILVDHLKKYAETGDESYIMSSVLRSIALTEEADEEEQDWETSMNEAKVQVPQMEVFDESTNIRIRHSENLGEVRYSDNPAHEQGPESPMKTNSSNRSTNSTAKTGGTSASQKSRNINTISPDKVPHLLHPEQGGMRFDTEKLTWIKAKRHTLGCGETKVLASSLATEEDPFQNIPDLGTTEPEDTKLLTRDSLDVSSVIHHAPNPELPELFQQPEELSESEFIPNAAPVEQAKCSAQQHKGTINSQQQNEDVQVIPDSRPRYMPKDYDEESDDTEEIPVLSRAPQRDGRELSVLFSSPPVSRQWEAPTWGSQSEKSISEKFDGRKSQILYDEADNSLVLGNLSSKESNVKVRERSASFRRRLEHQHIDRGVSLSRIDEHHEVSFVDQLPNGRSMSLTLSISTPIAAHRTTSLPVIHSSGLRNSKFFNSLSSLSEFTFHQNDDEHLETRCLVQNGNKIAIHDGKPRTALVLSKLVQKLSETEPDEPHWDWMRSLDLSKKDLDNLHGLDEFCSRLERLTIIDNGLSQLNGLPSSLRELVICNNSISDMTAWSHLTNLQYLDLSGNDLENVDGLGMLVHLRKLVLDDNRISSLEGLFELDGLISLSARRNKLEFLDFSESELGRVEMLDVSGNNLHTIVGLEKLFSLERLDISSNQLYSFPCRGSHRETQIQSQLHTLCIANNLLEDLEVSNMPSLEVLIADKNRLSEVRGISRLGHLKTLCLRSQEDPMDIAGLANSFDNFCEIQHLYLSGNHIPAINMTKHFYNLQTLELASTGLQSLPMEFGKLVPNLRTLNLNCNSLKSIRSLRGIVRLEKLLVVGNRLSRIRKTISVIETFRNLVELDLRDNPFSLGFWITHFNDNTSTGTFQETGTWTSNGTGGTLERHQSNRLLLTVPSGSYGDGHNDGDGDMMGLQPYAGTLAYEAMITGSTTTAATLQNELGHGDPHKDQMHYERLDEDTKLKRRIYELLLASNCPTLRIADGLVFDKTRVLKRDEIWDTLLDLGIVQAQVQL